MSEQRPLPCKTIGVLGGMCGQTADYYQLINKAVNKRLGGWDAAEIIIQGANFGNFDYFSRRDMWDEAGDYLSSRAQAAERGGAELLIFASHTMHRLADRITRSIHIPFIHVVDPTGAAIRDAGLKRVALLGTKPVMAADFLHGRYRERFGVDILVPHDRTQRRIDQIIFDELARGTNDRGTKLVLVDICASLLQEGAQGVIFCSGELAQAVEPQDMPGFPIFDATALHVEAAVTMALSP